MLKPLLLSLFALTLLSTAAHANGRDSGGHADEPEDRLEVASIEDLLEEAGFPKKKRKVACMGNEAFAAPHCSQYGHKIHTKGACFGDDPNDTVGVPAPCCCGG